MANNYDINYDDKRFTEVEADKKDALKENSELYGGMVKESDDYFKAQIDASKEWEKTQTKLQKEQTQFAIDQIEQQKDQAHKDYIKEQAGAYMDWQKQADPYGVNAEQTAATGMQNTGYSESSQVSMYNTYQNRVATAREAYSRAVLNYDNAIKDAQLQNNSVLAEIAYQALQQQLELSLQGFQYKNSLLIEQANKKFEIDNTYYSRYQDVLDQINHENALAEQIRQYNEKMAEEKRQYNETLALQKAQLAEEQRQFNETMAYNKSKISGSGGGKVIYSSGGGGNGGSSKNKVVSPKQGITKTNAQKVAQDNPAPAKKTGSSETVDMKSVIALGYGPISASRLAELEKQGLITSYKSGGKIKFKKSAYAIKQSMLFK